MLNHTTLQGRLVRDPETRQTQSGKDVCNITVAWSEKFNDTERQLFLDCTAWSGTATFIQKYFQKGSPIVVEGPLHTEKWQDKDGNNRSTTRMTISRAHFGGSKSDGAASAQPDTAQPAAPDIDGFEAVKDGPLPW